MILLQLHISTSPQVYTCIMPANHQNSNCQPLQIELDTLQRNNHNTSSQMPYNASPSVADPYAADDTDEYDSDSPVFSFHLSPVSMAETPPPAATLAANSSNSDDSVFDSAEDSVVVTLGATTPRPRWLSPPCSPRAAALIASPLVAVPEQLCHIRPAAKLLASEDNVNVEPLPVNTEQLGDSPVKWKGDFSSDFVRRAPPSPVRNSQFIRSMEKPPFPLTTDYSTLKTPNAVSKFSQCGSAGTPVAPQHAELYHAVLDSPLAGLEKDYITSLLVQDSPMTRAERKYIADVTTALEGSHSLAHNTPPRSAPRTASAVGHATSQYPPSFPNSHEQLKLEMVRRQLESVLSAAEIESMIGPSASISTIDNAPEGNSDARARPFSAGHLEWSLRHCLRQLNEIVQRHATWNRQTEAVHQWFLSMSMCTMCENENDNLCVEPIMYTLQVTPIPASPEHNKHSDASSDEREFEVSLKQMVDIEPLRLDMDSIKRRMEQAQQKSEQTRREVTLKRLYTAFTVDGNAAVGLEELALLGQARRTLRGNHLSAWTTKQNDTMARRMGIDAAGMQ